ncbi:MAG TPA: glycoside hydrolase family 99-like domain-containing protein [Terriglobia bacterium]|nr:glycoside hydrolase family 99-like domain-containing protein [Terriglobia bacterium]
MDRRTFMGAVPLSAAALHLSEAAHANPLPRTADKPNGWPIVPPGVPYFTREKVDSLVNTTLPIEGIPFQVMVYNFPSWHPSPVMEKTFGRGWTEFELARHAQTWFEGEIQPKQPLWGMYDPSDPNSFNEADPVWAAREIDLAADSGITGFMVDWYWHEGMMFYHEQLEQGFLRAPNRQRLKFALMWANHHWSNLYPAPLQGQEAILYPQTYSEADMDRITDYLLEHYLHEPNYWRINDQPVFAIFNIEGKGGILSEFGVEKLRALLDRMRNRVAKAGLKGLHIQASHVYKAGTTPLKEAGFDSVTHYHTFAGGPPGKTTEYAEAMEKSVNLWKTTAPKVNLPYFPDCPVGWDNSPRYGRKAHMFAHRTPDQFELQMLAAKYFVAGQQTKPPVIFLSAWNEWTEDHCLLPDAVYGYAFLDAVRRQFRPLVP